MKIPNDVLAILESELDGMKYGHAGLDVFIRDGKPRFEVSRRRSFYDNTVIKGFDLDCPTKTKKGVAR